jgi:hypothetical protein
MRERLDVLLNEPSYVDGELVAHRSILTFWRRWVHRLIGRKIDGLPLSEVLICGVSLCACMHSGRRPGDNCAVFGRHRWALLAAA